MVDFVYKPERNLEAVKQITEVESRMVEISEQKVMEKAKEIHAIWVEELRKSNENAEAKSLLHDPFQLLDSLRYKERPMMLTYEVLRAMSERNPIIASIIGTRVNQVSSFSSPPKSPYDIGFRIHLKDDEMKPNDNDKKRIKELEAFMENTGVVSLDPEERDDFDSFLRKISRDSLTYDQLAYEVIGGRGKTPVAFVGIDAATIRLSSTAKYFKNIRHGKDFGLPDFNTEMGSAQKEQIKPADVKYVQLIDGRVMTTYTEQEMGFGIRNPRTSIKQNGYGVSELEILVNTVTAHLWAEEYNRRFFSQGSAPKGIIHFEGNVDQTQLTAFRSQWHAQVMGVFNAWRTPIISAPAKLQYTNLQMSNKQMEFSAWIDYLIKIACAVYLIDPAEIGFDFKGGGAQTQTAPLFESRQESKQKMSRDKGLRPLLKFIQSEINKDLVYRLYEGRYEFEFIGLDAKTEEQLQEMHLKEVQNFKVIDEIRAEYDLEPLGHDRGGDVIMNSAYLNYLNQLQMQKMQQGGMGGEEGGMGGEEDYGQESGEEQLDFGQEKDMEEGENG
jgi:hypothetical protein